MITLRLDSVDLDRIADSGQCFRWQRLSDGRYAVPLHGTVFELRQIAHDAVEADGAWEEERLLSAMRAYLDAECDYASLALAADPTDAYLCAALSYGRGLRILRQPLWETLVSFIISQNNNIPRIRGIVERLCGGARAPFPAPQAVAAMGEEGIRAIGCGYRAAYLARAAERFTPQEERALSALSGPQARERLMDYAGVGGKVADCICLFGLGHKEAFPRDVWVKRILAQHYPQGFYLEDSPFAGVYQQLMFAYERESAGKSAAAGGASVDTMR